MIPSLPRRAALLAPLILAARPAWAHAVLAASFPAAGAVIPPGPTTIALRFNTRIDADRSRLSLRAPGGVETALSISPATRPDMLSASTALMPGPHVLRWQVLAADGHITRGDIPFTVRPG